MTKSVKRRLKGESRSAKTRRLLGNAPHTTLDELARATYINVEDALRLYRFPPATKPESLRKRFKQIGLRPQRIGRHVFWLRRDVEEKFSHGRSVA